MEQLRLIKGKDNFGIYAHGIAKVVSSKGSIVTEMDFDNGSGFYRFKVIGASKQIVDRAGNLKRQRQCLFCTVSKDSVFAKTAKDLNYGDVVEILGVIHTSEYTTDSGKQRKTSFCNLCKLTVIVKTDGETNNEVETEEDEFDEEDFTD